MPSRRRPGPSTRGPWPPTWRPSRTRTGGRPHASASGMGGSAPPGSVPSPAEKGSLGGCKPHPPPPTDGTSRGPGVRGWGKLSPDACWADGNPRKKVNCCAGGSRTGGIYPRVLSRRCHSTAKKGVDTPWLLRSQGAERILLLLLNRELFLRHSSSQPHCHIPTIPKAGGGVRRFSGWGRAPWPISKAVGKHLLPLPPLLPRAGSF